MVFSKKETKDMNFIDKVLNHPNLQIIQGEMFQKDFFFICNNTSYEMVFNTYTKKLEDRKSNTLFPSNEQLKLIKFHIIKATLNDS
jgi:hypothetical protein